MQYIDGRFVDNYYPTIENTFRKPIRIKGQDFVIEVVDTAGQDEYSILNSKHFIGIHGYMLVYSVASLSSFEMVQIIREKILNHLVSKTPTKSYHYSGNLSADRHSITLGNRVCTNYDRRKQKRSTTGTATSQRRGWQETGRQAELRLDRSQCTV